MLYFVCFIENVVCCLVRLCFMKYLLHDNNKGDPMINLGSVRNLYVRVHVNDKFVLRLGV